MSDAIAFDTYKFVKHLTEKGFTEEQAGALADEQVNLLNSNLATKVDIEAIKADIENLRLATKADIEKLRLETKADIEKLRLEVEADIEALKSGLGRWIISGVITGLITLSGVFITAGQLLLGNIRIFP